MCFGKSDKVKEAPHPAVAIGVPRLIVIHIPRNHTDQHGMPIPKTSQEIQEDIT